jgi:phage host-nuclease inhibitor protein Gam
MDLQSLDDCAAAMSDLLTVTLQLEGLVADRDLAVAKASATYEPAIDTGRARKADIEAALKAYYYGHLSEVEKDGKKSVQLANGVMGRRDNPARLALKNRQWTWAAVLAILREKAGDRFLRLRDPEIDKDLVKAEIAPEALGEVGLKLEQDETFYAVPARLPEVD